MPKLTYFPLMMDRWIAGTRHMTYEEKGFYLDLLIYLYEKPERYIKDEAHIARILGCRPQKVRRIWPRILGKFRRFTGGFSHSLVKDLQRNAMKVRGLQEAISPIDPDPDPDKEKRPKGLQKKAAKRGSRLPEDWEPNQAETEWATREFPGVDQRLEADKFRDYWLSIPGQRGCKLSWSRTWRNWLRNSKQTRKVNGNDDYDKPIRGSYEWHAERDKRCKQERLDAEEAGEILGSDDGVVWQRLEK